MRPQDDPPRRRGTWPTSYAAAPVPTPLEEPESADLAAALADLARVAASYWSALAGQGLPSELAAALVRDWHARYWTAVLAAGPVDEETALDNER